MTAYTLGDVARICKVSRERLRYWERTALLEPSDALDSRPAFAFRDIVSVRIVLDLLNRGVSLRRIRRSVEKVRDHMPDVEHPLGALRVWHEGSERVVVRHEGALFDPDGQAVLDFTSTAAAGDSVAQLGPRSVDAPTSDEETALEWFEHGCKLDMDRSTYGDAIEAYQRALEADPDFADAHCNLGSIHFNRDRRETARACFTRALEIDASHVEANLNLATMLEEDGRNEAALRHYKSALEADPLYADTHVSLALLYEKLELRRTARSYWRRYLQLEPSGTWSGMARKRVLD